MAAGLPWIAGPIFASYRLVCHQLPYRSFFLFGYQMAFCERDVAIYASMGLLGLAFALLRGRIGVRLSGDGTWRCWCQSPSTARPNCWDCRESTWELRVVTGALFGAATVWLAYPHLERFTTQVLAEARDSGREYGYGSAKRG